MGSYDSPYERQKLPAKGIPGSAQLQDGRDVIVTLLIEQSGPHSFRGPGRLEQPRGLLLEIYRIQLRDREQTRNVGSSQRLQSRGLGKACAIASKVGLFELTVLQRQQVVDT